MKLNFFLTKNLSPTHTHTHAHSNRASHQLALKRILACAPLWVGEKEAAVQTLCQCHIPTANGWESHVLPLKRPAHNTYTSATPCNAKCQHTHKKNIVVPSWSNMNSSPFESAVLFGIYASQLKVMGNKGEQKMQDVEGLHFTDALFIYWHLLCKLSLIAQAYHTF